MKAPRPRSPLGWAPDTSPPRPEEADDTFAFSIAPDFDFDAYWKTPAYLKETRAAARSCGCSANIIHANNRMHVLGADGVRHRLVHNLVSSAILRVHELAKARIRAKQWADNNKERRHAQHEKLVEKASAVGMRPFDYIRWKADERRPAKVRKLPFCRSEWDKRQREVDEQRVVRNLRTRLGEFLKATPKINKACGTTELVGCSREFLVAHLCRQLPKGYTLAEMSVDHIFPMSMYNFSDDKQQLMCMHWSNLQPLPLHGVGGNSSKSNKLPSLSEASKVQRWCWPANVDEAMLS